MDSDAREASGEAQDQVARKILHIQQLRFEIPVIKIA